jgi:hypothetical protein
MKKGNPEGRYLVEKTRKGRRKGVGQMIGGDRELSYGFRINKRGSRIISEEG